MKNERRLRSITLVYGVTAFLWLSPEDNRVWTVTLLGTAGAVLFCAHLWARWTQKAARSAWEEGAIRVVLGGVGGLVAAVATVVLMLLKTSLHLHVYPDYPVGVMLAILARAPAWSASGALIGVGWACLWGVRYLSEERRPKPSNPLRSPDGS